MDEQWDPDLTVREWWRRLFEAGYSYPTWPVGTGRAGDVGAPTRGAIHGVLGRDRRGRSADGPRRGRPRRADDPRSRHGRADRRRSCRRSRCGEAAWCQLFSEPGLGFRPGERRRPGRARRRRVGRHRPEGLELGGRPGASSGCCSPAPIPTSRSTAGMTYFVIDMDQPGVEVRPLKQMNGERRVLRGVPRRGPDSRRPRDRRTQRRVGGRPDDAVPRAQLDRRARLPGLSPARPVRRAVISTGLSARSSSGRAPHGRDRAAIRSGAIPARDDDRARPRVRRRRRSGRSASGWRATTRRSGSTAGSSGASVRAGGRLTGRRRVARRRSGTSRICQRVARARVSHHRCRRDARRCRRSDGR